MRPGENPGDYVLRLAQAKARAVRAEARAGEVVVASDTAVVDGETILGKPASQREAAEMLARLKGSTHQVYTAVAVLQVPAEAAAGESLRRRAPQPVKNASPAQDALYLEGLCVTDVTMRDYSQAEIAGYVASGDPMDKAGAYAIQHAGFHPVSRICGCYPSVMGLPLCTLSSLLSRLGYQQGVDIPPECSVNPDAPCDYFREFME